MLIILIVNKNKVNEQIYIYHHQGEFENKHILFKNVFFLSEIMHLFNTEPYIYL